MKNDTDFEKEILEGTERLLDISADDFQVMAFIATKDIRFPLQEVWRRGYKHRIRVKKGPKSKTGGDVYTVTITFIIPGEEDCRIVYDYAGAVSLAFANLEPWDEFMEKAEMTRQTITFIEPKGPETLWKLTVTIKVTGFGEAVYG